MAPESMDVIGILNLCIGSWQMVIWKFYNGPMRMDVIGIAATCAMQL